MEALYREYRPLLFYIAARKFHVPDTDCEPLVQEAVFSYLTSGPVENPRAWLVAVVCNASRHYWRVRARMSDMEGTQLDELEDLPQSMDIERLERSILVRRLLERLCPRDREVLRLHYFEGHTATEIAAALETTAGYAEKLICKALTHARREYERLHRAGVQRNRGVTPSAAITAGGPAENRLTRVQVFMRAHSVSLHPDRGEPVAGDGGERPVRAPLL